MWGDDPDRKPPIIKSDLPEPLPLSTWLIYIALALLLGLGGLFVYFSDFGDGGVVQRPQPAGEVVYSEVTDCALSDAITCTQSAFIGNTVTLVLANTNEWDITSGTVELSTETGSCEFDGSQTLPLFPSQSTVTVLFACADGTSYRNASQIENAIRITYQRDGAPLTRYAMGTINKTISVIE